MVYDNTLTSIVNDLLPPRKVRIRNSPLTPWFDGECRALRRKVRKAERLFRRTLLDDDRRAWIRALREKHDCFREKERRYWEDRIASNSGNTRRLWRDISTTRGRRPEPTVAPTFGAENYLLYLKEKVQEVRRATEKSTQPTYTPAWSCMDSFRSVTEAEVRQILCSSPSKSCSLDPIPTFLLREMIDDLLPYIVSICNASLNEAILPAGQKRAIVRPALKKLRLDLNLPSSYRPISNLTFMSKAD